MSDYMPPTDNLYKFASVAGLLLILVPAGFVATRIQDLQEKQSVERINLITLQEKVSKFELATKKLEREIDLTKKSTPSNEMALKLSEQEGQLQSLGIEVSTQVQIEKEHVRRAWELLIWCGLYAIAGLVCIRWGKKLALWGFFNWRDKVQIPEDAVLKNEAKHK